MKIKSCSLKMQFSEWVSQRILEHLVHVQGLKYSVKLCGGIQNEDELLQKFLKGGRVIMNAKRPTDGSALLIRIWCII